MKDIFKLRIAVHKELPRLHHGERLASCVACKEVNQGIVTKIETDGVDVLW